MKKEETVFKVNCILTKTINNNNNNNNIIIVIKKLFSRSIVFLLR